MVRVFLKRMILVLAFCGLVGCSNSGGRREAPKTAPVSGTLYLNGKPLDNAEIRFYSSDFVGFAVSNSEGKYELTQGAIPGENRITIRKVEAGYDPDPESGQDLSQLEFSQESAAAGSGEMSNVRKRLNDKSIPPQYSDPEKTQLTFNVPEEGADGADFRITSK